MKAGPFTLETFRAVLEDVLDVQNIDVRPEMTANDIPSWDSLNHVRLLVRLEQANGITFSAAEVEETTNVGDLLALINRLKLEQ
jgi:acyl carrier protein